MGLLDDFQDPAKLISKIGGTCAVCKFLSDITEVEAEKFLDLLNDKTIPNSALARILQNNGYRVPAPALNRHSRGDCLGVAR